MLPLNETASARVAVTLENTDLNSIYRVAKGAYLGFAETVETNLLKSDGSGQPVKVMIFQPEDLAANREFLIKPGGDVMVRTENDIYPDGSIRWTPTGLKCQAVDIIYPGGTYALLSADAPRYDLRTNN